MTKVQERSAGRPRKGVRAQDETRGLILDAAETLFAQAGFYGVTVREVTALAGVDVSLVYYYFDTKRDLFDAVFLRRGEILNADRMASIDAYDREHSPDRLTVEGAINAFLRPVLVRAKTADPGWRSYFALIAAVNNTPEWGGALMARSFDPVIQRLVVLLRKILPEARDEDLYWGYHFLSGLLTLSLSVTGRIDRLSDGLCRSDDFDEIEARMARYAAAGLLEVCRPR